MIPSRQLKYIDATDIRRSPEKFFMVDYCGCFICTAGHTRMTFFNKTYDVTTGTLALFHPFNKIVFSDYSSDISGYWCEIDLSQAIPVVNQVLCVENIEIIRAEPVVSLREDKYLMLLEKIKFFQSECDEIEREFVSSELCRPICLAILTARKETLILDILNQYYLSKSVSVIHTSNHDIVFQNFMIDLQKNYMIHRDTDFYAKRSSLSPKYFSSVIKEVSGASPSEWIIQTVVSVAQKYLRETTKTINEISGLMNFPSQGFFCKYFKRYTSLSPKEYRQNLIK